MEENKLHLCNFQIENLSKVGSCLDTMGHKNENETVGVSPCHNLGGHQFFSLSENNELRKDALCLDADNLSSPIKLFICHGQGGNQRWLYDEKVERLKTVLCFVSLTTFSIFSD